MALTRLMIVNVLIKRAGPLMTKAGMSTTVGETNADLQDPMATGLRQSGYSVADIFAVAEAEVTGVDSSDYDKVLDFAELRLLQNILGSLDDVDVRLGPRAESLHQLAETLEKRIDKVEAKLTKLYGYASPELETGVIIHEFAQHDETEL